jgi:hypothetical protein
MQIWSRADAVLRRTFNGSKIDCSPGTAIEFDVNWQGTGTKLSEQELG